MNNKLVEVKVFVDTTKPQEVSAFNTFLKALNGTDSEKAATLEVVDAEEADEEDEAEKVAAAKKRSDASKKAAATKKANAEKAKVKEEPEDDEEETEEDDDDLAGSKDEEDDITYDMLSDLLAAKVTNNRAKIKDKLAACKATKMSDLDEKYYGVMHSFLTKLKS